MEQYRSIDPASGTLLESFEIADSAEIERRLGEAATGFERWRRAPMAARAALLAKVGELLERDKEPLARLITTEMGKPIAQSVSEIEKCAWGCRYFAERGPALLEPEDRSFGNRRAILHFDPLGPLLAIMPWNFPFWQLFRFACPSILAGNTVVMKHAPSTPRCARAIDRLFQEAHAPAGVFTSLFLSNSQSAKVIADPRIRGVTLTGSTRAGRAVAEAAGRVIKKVVLELGGSDPFIVLEDADIDRVAGEAAAARCLNNGQSCISSKRFIVEDSIYERFRSAFVDRMKARRLGDPHDPATENGPMARDDLRTELAAQVDAAVAAGGTVLCGGLAPSRPGYYFEPTVIEGVGPEQPIASEELFGPVALLFRYHSLEELARIANGTPYGLGASIWTADPVRGEAIAAAIDAGNVFINDGVKSFPELPFGGVKDSGFGRELAVEGCREFTNLKVVSRTI